MSAHTPLTAVEHALPFRRCEVKDLFTHNDDDSEAAKAVLAASAEYLSAFAAPTKNEDGKPVCFHCGGQFNSFLETMGVGVAFRWGLAHGEAACSGCGWPARGMHYPKDANGAELWTARNLFLQYHPDFVEARS